MKSKKNVEKPLAVRLTVEQIKQLNLISVKLFSETNISLTIRFALKKFIEEHLNKDGSFKEQTRKAS